MPEAARLVRSPTATWRLLIGAGVVALPDGVCVRLNAPGAEVWDVLERPHALREVVAIVAGRFDMPETEVSAPIEALVSELCRLGVLVEVNT